MKGRAVAVFCLALGALYFILTLGTQILDPTEISWLMNKSDWAQHFLGWHFFRQESWHLPPGQIAGIENPPGASIGTTDSIPLLALMLKPAAGVLPDNFQYFGFWLLLCFCLQAVFAALLIRTVTGNVTGQVLGTAYFVISPILIGRIAHPALCSQWLLLASLWLYFRDWKSSSPGRPLGGWGIFVLLSALVHPYLAVMTLGLALAFYLRSWIVDQAIPPRLGLLSMCLLSFLAVCVWWLAGYFELGSRGQNYGSFGFGYFSMNLAAPINPVGWSGGQWGGRWSAFLEAWPAATKGQADGFNYLGLGVIVLGLGAAFASIVRPPRWRTIKPLLPLAFLFLCFGGLAISHKITFAGRAIVDIPLNHYFLAALAPLRSSGRFFWPVYYGAMFLIFAFILRRCRPKTGIAILLLGLGLQLADFREIYGVYEKVRHPAKEWANPLQSEIWGEIGEHYKRIVIVPPLNCEEKTSAPYEPFAYFAAKHGMTVNSFYLARYDYAAASSYCRKLDSDIKAGLTDPQAVYILGRENAKILMANAKSPVVSVTIDGFDVCLPGGEEKLRSLPRKPGA